MTAAEFGLSLQGGPNASTAHGRAGVVAPSGNDVSGRASAAAGKSTLTIGMSITLVSGASRVSARLSAGLSAVPVASRPSAGVSDALDGVRASERSTVGESVARSRAGEDVSVEVPPSTVCFSGVDEEHA
jgi:hypothetical protein